jgi:hypothetical protein
VGRRARAVSAELAPTATWVAPPLDVHCHPGPNCAPGTYYYLNNTNPAYDPDGTLKTSGMFVPPTRQCSIGHALGDRGLSWRFYGGGFRRGSG